MRKKRQKALKEGFKKTFGHPPMRRTITNYMTGAFQPSQWRRLKKAYTRRSSR